MTPRGRGRRRPAGPPPPPPAPHEYVYHQPVWLVIKKRFEVARYVRTEQNGEITVLRSDGRTRKYDPSIVRPVKEHRPE